MVNGGMIFSTKQKRYAGVANGLGLAVCWVYAPIFPHEGVLAFLFLKV